ncbi:hypothetical protein AX17_000206 [Amanita inopinata Kibby_2008]|nr:hypothetical protein AX17_000206 [Amanita inopinata Kibby_2008]
MTVEPPRILLIDSYDSFSYNLAALCRMTISNCVIHIIKNDEYSFEELEPYLDYFSAIIVGPGPGSPSIDKDIGVIRYLWTTGASSVLPIFGVCLGLQSLGVAYGAKLGRLRVVKHGQVSDIRHKGQDIFYDVGPVKAVRYHSLHIEPKSGGEIDELAWADDEDNGRVVMACKHKYRPFWAVQYHPESVCTNGAGAGILGNFWRLAQNWSAANTRRTRPSDSKLRNFGRIWPFATWDRIRAPAPQPRKQVKTIKLYAPHLSVPAACELLGVCDDGRPFVLLDSAASPGRFSIIGALLSTSLQVMYSVGDDMVTLKRGPSDVKEPVGPKGVWSWLSNFMQLRQAHGGHPEVPFWGGFIGYLTYEMGVDSLHIPAPHTDDAQHVRHPDVNLIFVERSIVLDLQTGEAYIQSLLEDDDNWLSEMTYKLEQSVLNGPLDSLPDKLDASVPTVVLPNYERYISSINRAKECLYSGDSYELCLTAHTYISTTVLPNTRERSSSWQRYKMLRKLNPAPHSAYLRMHPSTLLSSSPERFLSFTRAPDTICQLRPIKGTVRKAPDITRAVAEQALVGSNKEVAENLMIVDLIRHDLHSVVGDDVQVKQFCGVEEYETVWQLVSVIEGKGTDANDEKLGWDVLRRSLPPGSMTGAPKKRSVEILQSLEAAERSIYSGVFGYWCVSGGGDWSVTIRSCFKYEKESERVQGEGGEREDWVIGAGGAITALSDPEAEWEEMRIKLQSVLRAFGDGAIEYP